MTTHAGHRPDDIVVNARFLTHRITGLERYAIEVSRQMKALRPSLAFVAPRGIMHPSIAEELGVELRGFLTGHLWEQIELPVILRRRNSRLLINLVNTGPIVWRDQLTVIHDLAFLRNPEWFSRRAAMWFTFLVPRVVRASKLIVTQSAFTRHEVMALLGVPERNIRVIHPGVSSFFQPTGPATRNASAGAVVLAVSTLEPRKNVARLVEGFKLSDVKDARLVIVGGKNSLVFGTSDLPDTDGDPSIQCLGYVPDARLAELYRRADVFASVSLYEGFGFPPLEACACGCRVLVSDIPSHREIFGDNATYVDPMDPADIALKLTSLLAAGPLSDAERCRQEDVLARFDWRRTAESLLTAADEALTMR